jgi:hypothetical protein
MSLLFDLVPDGTPSQQEAQQIISSIASDLCQCWHVGWNDWITHVSEVGRVKLSKRSRANNVNDFAVCAARERFANRPGTSMDNVLGFFKLYVGTNAAIVLRFKRLNQDYLARNVKTQQQRRYYLNQPIAGIYPGAVRLTCGYILDPIEGGIQDVRISSQFGQKILVWSYSIMEPANTLVMPPTAAMPSSSVSIVPLMPAATGTEGA